MARVILITGGSRSGKSRLALEGAEAAGEPRTFVATCPVLDDEMAERVARHRQDRQGRGWATVEEPVDLAGALRRCSGEVVLVDCLTLWVNNLMYGAEQNGQNLSEEDIARECREVLAACAVHPGTVYLVTNEVGMGIVPDNPASRRYRDLAGRCNQVMAAGADEVILAVCGLPVRVK